MDTYMIDSKWIWLKSKRQQCTFLQTLSSIQSINRICNTISQLNLLKFNFKISFDGVFLFVLFFLPFKIPNPVRIDISFSLEFARFLIDSKK